MQDEISYYTIERPHDPNYSQSVELNLNIRTIRQARGLNIGQLAEMVGVSGPHLSGVERGVKNLNNHLILRLAAALKVEPKDLIASNDHRGIDDLVLAARGLEDEDLSRLADFAAALKASKQASQQIPKGHDDQSETS